MVEDIIQANNNEIASCNREIEALREFKKVVGRTENNFASVNRDKKAILSRLDYVKHNNKSAYGYQNGMRDSLTGVGEAAIVMAFVGLKLSIDHKILEKSLNIARLQTINAGLSLAEN